MGALRLAFSRMSSSLINKSRCFFLNFPVDGLLGGGLLELRLLGVESRSPDFVRWRKLKDGRRRCDPSRMAESGVG